MLLSHTVLHYNRHAWFSLVELLDSQSTHHKINLPCRKNFYRKSGAINMQAFMCYMSVNLHPPGSHRGWHNFLNRTRFWSDGDAISLAREGNQEVSQIPGPRSLRRGHQGRRWQGEVGGRIACWRVWMEIFGDREMRSGTGCRLEILDRVWVLRFISRYARMWWVLVLRVASEIIEALHWRRRGFLADSKLYLAAHFWRAAHWECSFSSWVAAVYPWANSIINAAGIEDLWSAQSLSL